MAGCRTVPVEVGSRYTDEEWSQTLLTVDEFIDRYILKKVSRLSCVLLSHRYRTSTRKMIKCCILMYFSLCDSNSPRVERTAWVIWLSTSFLIRYGSVFYCAAINMIMTITIHYSCQFTKWLFGRYFQYCGRRKFSFSLQLSFSQHVALFVDFYCSFLPQKSITLSGVNFVKRSLCQGKKLLYVLRAVWQIKVERGVNSTKLFIPGMEERPLF